MKARKEKMIHKQLLMVTAQYNELIEKKKSLVKKNKDLVQRNKALVEKNEYLVKKNEDLDERNKDLVEKNESLVENYSGLVKQLRDKVECPVCYDVPKKAPIPVCPNGHVVCNKCVRKDCPTCRVKMEQGKSSLAVTIIENIDHQCDNEGCQQTVPFGELTSHGKCCDYRLVNCPGLECQDKIALSSLATHMVFCGSLVGNKINVYKLPYVFNYFTIPDDKRHELTWQLNAIRFDERIFLLKIYRKNVGGIKRWLFAVQIVGGEEIASGFGVTINVHRPEDGPDGKYSQKYSGDVCSIDVTDMSGAEEKGQCLSLTDWDMGYGYGYGYGKFSVSVDIFGTD